MVWLWVYTRASNRKCECHDMNRYYYPKQKFVECERNALVRIILKIFPALIYLFSLIWDKIF